MKIFLYQLYLDIILRVFLFYFLQIEKGKVNGLENLQKYSSYILVINHVSYLDWLILYAYFKYHHRIKIKFLAKEKLFNHPVWKPLMYAADCIKVPEKYSIGSYKELSAIKII